MRKEITDYVLPSGCDLGQQSVWLFGRVLISCESERRKGITVIVVDGAGAIASAVTLERWSLEGGRARK